MSDKLKKLKEQFDNYKCEPNKRKSSDLEKMLDMPIKIPKSREVNKNAKSNRSNKES